MKGHRFTRLMGRQRLDGPRTWVAEVVVRSPSSFKRAQLCPQSWG